MPESGAAAGYPFPVVNGSIVDMGANHPVILAGYDLYNSGATQAVFYLRDGRLVTDPIRIPISLNPGESTSDWWDDGKIFGSGGVFFQSVANTAGLVGTLWIS